MIEKTKCSWPIEPIQVILTRIKGPSQRLTNFVIAGQQYCFKRLFYGIPIGPAAFSSFMSSIVKPLVRKNKIITYLDDVFIQDTTTDTMLQTLTQYHTILKNENFKAAPDNSFFSLDSVKFLGHQIQNYHIHPLKSQNRRMVKTTTTQEKKKKIKTMSDFSPLFQIIYTTHKSFFDLFISNSDIQQILNELLNYKKHLI